MQLHGTRLEVDLNALDHNVDYIKRQLAADTKFVAVVKANAYGHGAVHIARRLQELQVDYLAVAYVSEAIELRDNGIYLPIIVLHLQPYNIQTCIERCVEPVIYSVDMLHKFVSWASGHNIDSYPIHIEFNTGLNRIGIDVDDLDQVITIINSNQCIQLKGLQSHLAASEDHNEQVFTNTQLKQFATIRDRIKEKIPNTFLSHTSNTSGLLNYPKARFDMVRSGIGIYGFTNDSNRDHVLKPIAALKSVISQTRWINPGDSISYNRSFIAKHKMQYAVVAIGHGDGINRIYGHGKASVYINGIAAATIGVICMDMLMVDITGINCNVGDEVIIFNHQHTARAMAETAGTISYELITGIQKRVPRYYIK